MDTELTLWAIERERRVDVGRLRLANCARSTVAAPEPRQADRPTPRSFAAACRAVLADPLHRRRPA